MATSRLPSPPIVKAAQGTSVCSNTAASCRMLNPSCPLQTVARRITPRPHVLATQTKYIHREGPGAANALNARTWLAYGRTRTRNDQVELTLGTTTTAPREVRTTTKPKIATSRYSSIRALQTKHCRCGRRAGPQDTRRHQVGPQRHHRAFLASALQHPRRRHVLPCTVVLRKPAEVDGIDRPCSPSTANAGAGPDHKIPAGIRSGPKGTTEHF